VIERTQSDAVCRDLPAAVGNHWMGLARRERARGSHSVERVAQMQGALGGDASWLAPPIVNRYTCLVASISPARGRLILQGWGKDGPVTAQLTL
jgi:hypothetical protein